MTTLSVQPAYPVFHDFDGQPLESGYIWIGAVNLSPQANPIMVYWDAALTIPAVQPIRTLAGYPSRSGTPARLYVGSDYSILVQDRKGSMIYTSMNATERFSEVVITGINANAVQYTQGAVGSITRSLDIKIRESISVTDFGAVGNGLFDSTTAFTAAIAAAAGKSLFIPDGNFAVSGDFTVPNGTTIYGRGFGSKIKILQQGKNLFNLGDDCVVTNIYMEMITGNVLDITKQNAVFVADKKRVTISGNWIKNAENCSGIYCANVLDSTIENNTIWGGFWDGVSAGVGATVADILFYSSTTGARCSINGNKCLSNNSQGIYFNALGYDFDSIISNNICVTMNASTWVEQANGGNRRHGIVAAYGGSNMSRLSVVGNIARNTRWSGIYVQSSGSGTGQGVVVTGNVCSLNGQQTTESLAGGIWIATNGGEVVTNNVITAFAGTSGNGAIVVSASTVGGVSGTSVIGNSIFNSAGNGIYITNRAKDVLVSKNTIQNSAARDILVEQTAGDTGLGGHVITDNMILRNVTTGPSIRVDLQAGTKRCTISGNNLRGKDNTTAAASNAGISIAGLPPMDIYENTIDTYYYGVDFTANVTASTRYFNEFRIDRNYIYNCNQGIGIAASAASSSTVPCEGNAFLNNSSNFGTGSAGGFAVGYAAFRLDGTITIRTGTTAPANGTWAVGDRAIRNPPAGGSPRAWTCTVAGTPGTWASEGNL